MGKRILSFTLCLLLALSLLPTAAFADTTVNSVQVNIAAPFANDTPSQFVTCWNSDAYRSTSVDWHDDTANRFLAGSDKFVKGHVYTAQIYMKTNDGWVFNFDGAALHVTGRVNYQAAQVSRGYELDNSRQLLLSYTFAPCREPIASVPVGVPELLDGERFLTKDDLTPDPENLYGGNCPYLFDTSARANFVNGVSWYDETAKRFLRDSDTYVYGHVYRVSLALKPAGTDKGFMTATDGSFAGSATVNGKKSNASTVSPYDPTSLIVTYTFPQRCRKEVGSIVVTGVTPPAAREYPTFTADVPVGAGYEISDRTDGTYTYGMAWYFPGEKRYVPEDERFDRLDIYELTLILEAQENCCFAEGATATVNGIEAKKVELVPGEGGSKTAFVTVRWPSAPSSLIDSLTVEGFVPPEAGMCVSVGTEAKTVGDERCRVMREEWHNDTDGVTMAYGDRFLPGKTYTVRLRVTADMYSEFTPIQTATVNGETWPVELREKEKMYSLDEYTAVHPYKTFALPMLYAEQADFTVTVPQGTQSPNFQAECDVETHVAVDAAPQDHFVNGVGWYDETAEAWLTNESAFVKGHEYTVYIRAKTLDGWEFKTSGGSSAVQVTLNGEAADRSGNAHSLTITRRFTCGGILVSAADPQLDLPQIGRNPDFSAVVSSDRYQVKTDADGYTDGVRWFDTTTGDTLTAESVFEDGHAYAVSVVLEPKDGYEFPVKNGASSVSACISDIPAQISRYESEAFGQALVVTLNVPTLNNQVLNGPDAVPVDFNTFESPFLPTHGAKAPYMATTSEGYWLWSAPNDANYENGVRWVDKTAGRVLRDGDCFIGGHAYTLELQLRPDFEHGYRFDDTTTVRLNGVSSDMDPNSPVVSLVDGVLHYRAEFDCPAEVIASVELLDVEYLLEGMTTADGFLGGAKTAAPEQYGIVAQEAWYNETAGAEIPWSGTYDFLLGGTYTMKIVLEAKDGYLFDPAQLPEATVNREPAACHPSVQFGEDGRHMTVSWTVTCARLVEEFAATVTAPENGKLPTFTCELPDGAGYEMVSMQWFDEKGNEMEGNNPFEEKSVYRVRIVFAPTNAASRFDACYSEGRYWPGEGVSATVNGEPALLYGTEEAGRQRIEYVFDPVGLTPVGTVAVYGVAEPRMDTVPAFAASVDENAPYTLTGLYWWDTDEDQEIVLPNNENDPEPVFEDGKTYALYAELQAKDGYCFEFSWDWENNRYATDSSQTALVNERFANDFTPLPTANPAAIDSRYTLWLRLEYEVTDKRIYAVEVYNAQQPVTGTPAGFAAPQMPLSVNYSLFDANEEGFVHGVCWYDETDEVCLTEGCVFLPGHEYTMSVWVKAQPDWSFWTSILYGGNGEEIKSLNTALYWNGNENYHPMHVPESELWTFGEHAIGGHGYDACADVGRGGTLRFSESESVQWYQAPGEQAIRVAGCVCAQTPVLAASYDAAGRLLSCVRLTSPQTVAPAQGAARLRLFWLDQKFAPRCGFAEVPLT